MAGAHVSPGDSMPTRLMNPSSSRSSSCLITKSLTGSPGAWSLARMPAMSGCRSTGFTDGKYLTMSLQNGVLSLSTE